MRFARFQAVLARAVAAVAVLLLAGCVGFGAKDGVGPSGTGAGMAPKPNPMLAEAISTTTLDAAPTPQSPAPTKAPAASPESTPAPDQSAPPPDPQSPEEVKCLKAGHAWASTGTGGAMACVKRTKDGGKACTRQTQCEGYCLARSRSCAPITPMFGCNDILQADGSEATLCLD